VRRDSDKRYYGHPLIRKKKIVKKQKRQANLHLQAGPKAPLNDFEPSPFLFLALIWLC